MSRIRPSCQTASVRRFPNQKHSGSAICRNARPTKVCNAQSFCLSVCLSQQLHYHTNAMSTTLQSVFGFFVTNLTLNNLDIICAAVFHGISFFSSSSSLQEEHPFLSLLRQAEAAGPLLSQVDPKTVLFHLWVIARVTHPHILQWTHPNYSNRYWILLQY